jgi:carboxyl-terminal processing protease
LPLNEQARVAQRKDQEAQYLAIENTRRKAKGMEALLSLDEMFDTAEDTAAEGSESGSEEGPKSMDDEDALITETARILVDAINLSGPVMARARVR